MMPLERVLTALSYKEPDRVPLLQGFSFYGAKELGITIKDYFSNPENIVEGQLRMQKKYNNDGISASFYASLELEAFGGSSIFIDDGPPNAGAPIINSLKDIESLKAPDIKNSLKLQKVLQTIQLLKNEVDGYLPITALVISPFSLPVMQMGFDKYLDLLMGNYEMAEKLIRVNQEFSIQWANAQLEAGANAICYFDPVSSPTIIPKEMYKRTGWLIAKETISAINGNTAIHFASGRTIPVINELSETGTNIISASSQEDIGEVKRLANSKMAVMGNLNGIEMCRWDKTDAQNAVKDIISKAGKGGGLLISDNHGEVPYQVPEKVLLAIADAVNKYGIYE
jgi:uroporphyrinogen decarboxylase